jgi:translation initiation factor 1
MSKKNKADQLGFVYSTNPDFKFNESEKQSVVTLLPADQKLLIQLDNKRRGGKTVTLITGFSGQEPDLEILAKSLRNFCGTGGSAKDGEAIVQGDQRDKIFLWLTKNGYSKTRKK